MNLKTRKIVEKSYKVDYLNKSISNSMIFSNDILSPIISDSSGKKPIIVLKTYYDVNIDVTQM
jgi:hypothetical protein